MDELSKRNFHALSEGLKEQRSKTSELTKQINNYTQVVGQLQVQVQSLQSQVGILLAKQMGNGRTT